MMSALLAAWNPFDGVDASELEQVLRATCAEGLNATERAEVADQIEALVPALAELRDGGHLALTTRTLVAFGTLDGFIALAGDARLTALSRRRCEAICVRLIVHGVKVLLNGADAA